MTLSEKRLQLYTAFNAIHNALKMIHSVTDDEPLHLLDGSAGPRLLTEKMEYELLAPIRRMREYYRVPFDMKEEKSETL